MKANYKGQALHQTFKNSSKNLNVVINSLISTKECFAFEFESLRRLLGEGLDSCSIAELEELQQQLQKSVNNVRARKVEYLLCEWCFTL